MLDQDSPYAKRATIEDVATHAGVSRAAVSKVLRDAYGLSDDMRNKVNRSIEALNYRPRISARGMRGSTFTLGVVISDFSNNFVGEVMEGVASAIAKTQFQIIVAVLQNTSRESYEAIENLYDRQVDGILAISPLAEPDWLDEIASKVPFVQLGLHMASQRYDTIVGDDVRGVELMMRHLFDLGHSDIAHLTSVDPVAVRLNARPHIIRLRAYERIMREAGLADRISVVEGRFEERAAYDAAVAAFGKGLRPTAMFAGNDDAALGTMRAAAEFDGLEQLSISGYDDSHIAANPRIGLTTVNQDGPGMGQQAAQLLLERVQGRSESRYITVPTRLIVRSSTFAPS